MRTYSVLAAAILVACLSSPAIGADTPAFGVTAGVNLGSARLSGTDAAGVTTSSEAGVNAGVFAIWPIAGIVSIEPGVAFAQKHFSTKDTTSGFTAKEKWDWVEVPILARVSLWHGGSGGLHALAGPGFNFRARAREDAGGTTSDVKNFIQSTDVSFIAGGGISFGHAGVDVVYDGGLRDLNKDHNLGDNLTVKSRAVRISATWTFR